MSKKSMYLAKATCILCVLLFAVKWTGPIVHVICGILLTVISVNHLWRRRRGLCHARKGLRVVDWVLTVSLVVMFVSGLLLHPMRDSLGMLIAHKLSSVLFVVFVIAHGVQHMRKRSK